MKRLLTHARAARRKAYAPYSHYAVGAALETHGGKIYSGCNVENASYGLSLCAERVAVAKAIADGARKFKRLVIVTGGARPATPCGMCRQVLMEFAPHLEVVISNGQKSMQSFFLTQHLLPYPFQLKRKKKSR